MKQDTVKWTRTARKVAAASAAGGIGMGALELAAALGDEGGGALVYPLLTWAGVSDPHPALCGILAAFLGALFTRAVGWLKAEPADSIAR